MPNRYLTEEEILARKLFAFLCSVFALLVFAGVVFYLASTPPSMPQRRHKSSTTESAGTEPQGETSPFMDQIARIRFGPWSVEKRKEKATALLARAPNSTCRKEVENLLSELTQEQAYEKRKEFQELRIKNSELIKNQRFQEAEKLLDQFAEENSRFQELVKQERERIGRARQRACEKRARLAELAIRAGNVEKTAELFQEVRSFAGKSHLKQAEKWVKRAERRAAELKEKASTASAQGEKEGPASKEEKQPGGPPSKAGTHPKQKAASEEPPKATEFSALLSAQGKASNRFSAGKDSPVLTVDLSNAEIFVDEVLSREELFEALPRGSAIWILGNPKKTKTRLRQFGLTLIKRIESPDFAFLADHFLPPSETEKGGSPVKKWLFGKTVAAYPVLRVEVEDDVYLVSGTQLPVIQRTKPSKFPQLPPGGKVWVKGTRTGNRIEAESMVVLAGELIENEGYLKLLSK